MKDYRTRFLSSKGSSQWRRRALPLSFFRTAGGFVAATGYARLQADEESVENAEKLVETSRAIRRGGRAAAGHALKLKATWDDLQLQATAGRARRASQADTARAAADGAALSWST